MTCTCKSCARYRDSVIAAHACNGTWGCSSVTPARRHSRLPAARLPVRLPFRRLPRTASGYSMRTNRAAGAVRISSHSGWRAHAGLVLVEASVGVQSRHADINAGLRGIVIGIAFLELCFLQHVLGEKDDVDVVMMSLGHLLKQLNLEPRRTQRTRRKA